MLAIPFVDDDALIRKLHWVRATAFALGSSLTPSGIDGLPVVDSE